MIRERAGSSEPFPAATSEAPQAGGLTKGSDGGPRAAALSAFYVCDLILPAEVEKRVIGIAALIQGWKLRHLLCFATVVDPLLLPLTLKIHCVPQSDGGNY